MDDDNDSGLDGLFALVQVAGQVAFVVACISGIATLCGYGAVYTFFKLLKVSLFGE